MKAPKINVMFISVLTLWALSAHALEDKHAGEEHQDVQASDYIGVSMEIPKKIQELIGMKTVKAVRSRDGEKVHVNGRIPQDAEDFAEVYVPQRGELKECMASLGSMVSKGQVICRVESESTKEIIEVTSPASGVIIGNFSKPGDMVDAVTPIHTIADYSRLPVSFDVYEKDAGKIQMGQRVLVYSSAYPEQPFEGKIVFVSPRVDETSFTLKIRAMVDNPDYRLKPGMFVRGEILLDTGRDHIAVPSDGVQNLDGIDVVFVQDEDGSFVPTAVRVTYVDNGLTLVAGDISEKDFIVVDGAYNLKSKILENEIVGGCAHGH